MRLLHHGFGHRAKQCMAQTGHAMAAHTDQVCLLLLGGGEDGGGSARGQHLRPDGKTVTFQALLDGVQVLLRIHAFPVGYVRVDEHNGGASIMRQTGGRSQSLFGKRRAIERH